MATTNFKGQPVKLIGEFIQVGKVAPDFELVKTDLSSFSLKDLKGKNVVLNIFPSLDTSVCATSVRKFNKMAAGLKIRWCWLSLKTFRLHMLGSVLQKASKMWFLCRISVIRILTKAMVYAWPMVRLQVCWRVR